MSGDVLLLIWLLAVVYLLARAPVRQGFDRPPPDTAPPRVRTRRSPEDDQP